MRLAHLDAFAGVSGDMLLAALIDAGAPVDSLRGTLAALNLGATLEIRKVDRSGIRATQVHILSGEQAADAPAAPHHHHHHEPHRSLAAIRKLIRGAGLDEAISERALRAFDLLGEAEAKIHGIPLKDVHFHEVGAVDAIADIVLTSAAAHALKIEAWSCSALNVGGGTVQCAHGRYPVPAPATTELLRGAPVYSEGVGEMVTPTGAALVCALGCSFRDLPPLTVEAVGYGAGTRNPPGFANVVRLSLGQAARADRDDAEQEVVVIETALDDCSPQVIAHCVERMLEEGALDVMRTPVFMKKNRSGTLLTVLVDPKKAAAMEDLLLRETSTLGLRVRRERRVCLERTFVQVATPWGPVRMKLGLRDGAEMNAAPEFEDCRALAVKNGVPLKQVQEAALLAHRRGQA